MDKLIWKEKALDYLKVLSECSIENFLALHSAPYRSLNIGATGIAYAFWKAACVLDDANWLNYARFWIDHVLAMPEDNRVVGLSEEEGGVVEIEIEDSLYHGNRGVYLVRALIAYSQADDYHLNKFLTKLEEPATRKMENEDLLQGTPGRLMAFAITYDEMGYDYIKEGGRVVAEELLNTADFDSREPLWGNNHFLGIAHGRSGILYSLLFWHKVSGYKLPDRIPEEVKRIAEFGIKKEHGFRWPMRDDNNKRFLDSWCHGNPGLIDMWSLAYELYGDPFFLETARKAGEFLIHHKEYQLGHICCGAGGVSYSMLSLNRVDPGGPWLEQAIRYAEMAERARLIPRFRLGLYTGLAGIACLMLDMIQVDEARQPVFQG